MAIIKCDDELPPAGDPSGGDGGDGVTVEAYVEQDEVSLGKTLLAVESGFFLEDTISLPVLSDLSTSDSRELIPLLTTRPQDISDTLRADSNRYWTLDENGNMKYMNVDVGQTLSDNANIEFPTPPFWMARYTSRTTETGTTDLGLPIIKEEYVITARDSHIPNDGVWKIFINGGTYTWNGEEQFSRPSPLILVGETFTDHAFQMNTPFSKKELEMFANIVGDVSVADVESDYDFFSKAYEEGIASTNVPENALPHLYTEVQRGESEAENTIVSVTTTQENQVEEGYFRQWINDILSNQEEMNSLASAYENVAILDSVVGEENILDSENKTTSAFEILMAYANRENLFPMNVNIEVDTNNASDLMSKAEDVGMVDDIVRFLMGDGDTIPADHININPINPEIAADSDESMQFSATFYSGGILQSISPTWAISTTQYGTITSDGLFTPIDEESEETTATPHTVKVTAYYESMEASVDFLIHPVYSPEPEDTKPGNRGAAPKIDDPFGTLVKSEREDSIDESEHEAATMGEQLGQ